MLDKAESTGREAVEPFVRIAVRRGVSPNTVTVASVAVAFVAALFLYAATPAAYVAATVLVVLNGVFDMVDGELARRTGQATDRGDLLDHAADRYADTAVVVGAAAGVDAWLLGFFAVSGVLFVAEAGTKAQAAGAGRIYGGALTRADISTLVGIGAVASAAGLDANGYPPFVVVLGLFAVGGHVTTVQRLVVARRTVNNS